MANDMEDFDWERHKYLEECGDELVFNMYKLFHEKKITKTEAIPVVCQALTNMLANMLYEKEKKLPELDVLIKFRKDFCSSFEILSDYMFERMVKGCIRNVK